MLKFISWSLFFHLPVKNSGKLCIIAFRVFSLNHSFCCNRQFEFQPNVPTTDALVIIAEKVKFLKNKVCCCILFDVLKQLIQKTVNEYSIILRHAELEVLLLTGWTHISPTVIKVWGLGLHSLDGLLLCSRFHKGSKRDPLCLFYPWMICTASVNTSYFSFLQMIRTFCKNPKFVFAFWMKALLKSGHNMLKTNCF